MRAAVLGRGPVGQFLAAQLGVEPMGRHGVPEASASLVFLAVPDRSIPAQAARLRTQSSAALVHCSGATPRAVLGEGPAAIWHPMCAFPAGAQARLDLHGVVVGLRGDDGLCDWLAERTQVWRGTPVIIDEEQAVAVHAACCFAAGFCASIAGQAVAILSQAGLHEDVAKQAVRGLSLSAIDGYLEGAGLTGPALRGDAATVAAHLDVLGHRNALYKALTRSFQDQQTLHPDIEDLLKD